MIITVALVFFFFLLVLMDVLGDAPSWAAEYAYTIKVEMGLIIMILVAVGTFCL